MTFTTATSLFPVYIFLLPGDDYYWKLTADFIGPQSGEDLDLENTPCRNRILIQVGLMKEDNSFPWVAILDWLKKIFPRHHSADFRRLIERGIVTTLSLGPDARQTFLESAVNFGFVGPICDSIGVEREHLLELRDFSEQAQSIEVTNGLILELINFVNREKIAPVILVTWLKNFNPDFCKSGDVQKAYKNLRRKIKRFKMAYRNSETRSHRRNAAMENLLQSPFELVNPKKKLIVKKRIKRDPTCLYDRVAVKEENERFEISQGEGSEVMTRDEKESINKLHAHTSSERTSNKKGESLTLLDIAILSIQKMSSMYGGNAAAQEESKKVSLDLLKNQYILMCKENPAVANFDKKLSSLGGDVTLASPADFLMCNARFLVDMHNAIEQQIINSEKEIMFSTGEKLGRDKLHKFRNFVNLSESATSRFIHMALDILSSRTPGVPNYRKHWVAFCDEKKNPSKLALNHSERFNSYFETAAGLLHHHREIALFFSDLLAMDNDKCPNVILESVAADACDPMIQSFVCVLSIVYCKILGPYWQLLTSIGEYSMFSKYLLCLYQKFLDWSKDPSTLLEPEEETNVFLQVPWQEKTFHGVFQYCGEWHTNRDLIRACLKRMVKLIAAVTDDHLKDFLPGGKLSQVPSPELGSQLVSCTFSVLMADYPFSNTHSYENKKRDRRKLLGSSAEDDYGSNSSDSTDESYTWRAEQSPQAKRPNRGEHLKVEREYKEEEEEEEENMDRDYIIATVNRNGGPCKTQQDLDKMLVRFDGKPRTERREAIRCEVVYQKMILNNTALDDALLTRTNMLKKLRLALPRLKPGFSLVWAPRKTKPKVVLLPPVRAASVEAAPVEAASVEAAPVEAAPVEGSPADVELADATLTDVVPSDASAGQNESSHI